mmetsp:Transcript_92349/g.238393  ORF Transcript_92349/g.238393 Transcript_92349/m.238393 type:complete len:381 (+) Transcript_92349:146-1288(+)
MPIYEEKLLCPLAVRFTQDHIRPVFQDGRDLEATIAQIKTKPGMGPYDLILEAPFPAIEIVRWYQRHPQGTTADAKHWCTLDNRRLYCMQRAAVALWPKRVAVIVEVLYAATEGVMRKNDSSTAGLSVSIGHSPKALTDHWDWRNAAAFLNAGAAAMQVIQDLVASDDVRGCVAELVDAPAGPSMLDRFFAAEAEQEAAKPVFEDSSCSTTHPSSPRSFSSDSASSGSSRKKAQASKQPETYYEESWVEGLEGTWRGEQGEVYEICAATETSWTCVKTEVGGCRKTYTLWYDEASDAVWWGNGWTLYLDANEARTGPQVGWYATNGGRKPRFSWTRVDDPSAAPVAPEEKGKQSGKANRQGQQRKAANSNAGAHLGGRRG